MKHLLLWQILAVKTVLKCFFAEMQTIFPVSSAACQAGWLIPVGGFPSNESVLRGKNFLEGITLAGSAVLIGGRSIYAWVHEHV